MSGFHCCVTCKAKLPANNPHEDCVACLGPEHAASALADRSFCALCANFQPRTLRQRARKAVGSHSPSSGSSYTLSVRHRGRSRSLRWDRRYRDKSGVVELTSKMSQFMDVMMGQQSLLMSLTNMAPRATDAQVGPTANQPTFPPQPLATPVVQQPQGVWDVDAISRDASEGEPLLEEDSVEAELTSQPSEQDTELEVLDTNDPLWSLVEGATHHLGIEWPAVELPRRSLFESPSVQSPQPRMLPAFPDFIKEGTSVAGLASFQPVDAAFAALVRTPTLSGLAKDPACPNRQCRTTEVHLKKGYSAATEAVQLSNVASLFSVYQASLVKDLPEHLSVSLRAELALVAQLLVKIAQLNARAQGRSIASLVVRRQLWLSQARVREPDKAPLLDAPITPGHTFGPAVEEMLQRSAKTREASQQMARMWPHMPFQPKRAVKLHLQDCSVEGGALE
ncbi:UNVERIFIED_CONTAM: hypothetical protein FKN15_035560 [Acipenser sinensis]